MFRSIYHRVLVLIGLACAPQVWAVTNLEVITEGGQADYPTRYRLTYTIDSKLSDENRGRLEKFLSLPLAKGGLEESELAALKNNVADALIRQDDGPRDLFKLLQTDWADADQGMIWRSYIVQKIPELTLKLKNENEIKSSVNFLRKLAIDSESEFSATAIMGMDRLHTARPDLIRGEEVVAGAARFFGEKEQSDTGKITILQIWARHDSAPALEEARRILLSENAHVLLKMSALSVLGSHGTQADLALIERYTTSPEGRLSTAAESARGRFSKRIM